MLLTMGCQGSSAMEAAAPPCPSAAVAHSASAHLVTADQLIGQRSFRAAISALDRGISLLGEAYFIEGMEDDTGQKLLLSTIEQQGGRLEVAAHLRQAVLSSRLAAYKQAHACGK